MATGAVGALGRTGRLGLSRTSLGMGVGAVVALDSLLESRRVWRGQPAPRAPSRQPTGHALLDDALPDGGWPEHALTELLLPADGIGELRLLWPTLARLSQADGMVALVDPPYLPFAQGWASAGIDLKRLQVVRTDPRNALWATEQCLRSAACSAVLCWPRSADDRTLLPDPVELVPAAEHKYWMDDGEMSRAPAGRMEGLFKNNRRVFNAEVLKRVKTYDAGKEVVPGLTSVATPGHTPDHLAFEWETGQGGGILFAGDLLLGAGDTTLVSAPYGNVADYLASLTVYQRSQGAEVQAAPGH